MGIYVQFWHGSADGLLGHFLSGPLQDFRAWCENTLAEYPDDLEPALVPLLEALQHHGRRALCSTTVDEALLVDGLLDTYYGFFCDSERPDLLEKADDSTLYVCRYHTVLDGLAKASTHGAEVVLWSYLLRGRPVERDPKILPYTSEDGVFRLSYWSAEETELLGRTFTSPPARSLRDVDNGALHATTKALRAAMARNSGLIITVS